jgi:hypothetical protein
VPLIGLWLFQFPIFLFAAQPKISLGWVIEVRTTKCVELSGEYLE